MFSKDICYILPNFHFMFLIDIDPISKIFEILLDGYSSFVGARLFENRQHFEFQKMRFIKHMFLKMFGIFIVFLGILVSPKIKNSWFWGLVTGSETMKSGFYCTNLKQINSTKLLNLLFKHMSFKNA